MQPLGVDPYSSGSDDDSHTSDMSSAASSTDVKVHATGVKVPILPLTENLKPATDNVVLSPRPWNTPRGSYIGKRTEFSAEDVGTLTQMGKNEWIFMNYSFTPEAAKALKDHLRSPVSHVQSIKFVNCALDPKFMKEFCKGVRDSKSISSLQIEGCVLSKRIGFYIRRALEKGAYGLRSLNFINVTIPTETLNEIVKGIVSQNDLVQRVIAEKLSEDRDISTLFLRVCQHLGVNVDAFQLTFNDVIKIFTKDATSIGISKTDCFEKLLDGKVGVQALCLEGCRMGTTHGKPIADLIARSTRLKELNLQGNSLGSSKNILKARTPRDRVLRRHESLAAPSDAIVSIAHALEANKTLTNLILSSNKVSASDWRIFYDLLSEVIIEDRVVHAPRNDTVVINLTNNQLEKQLRHTRLILAGSSPRSHSCPAELAESPRLTLTPRSRSVSAEEGQLQLSIQSTADVKRRTEHIRRSTFL